MNLCSDGQCGTSKDIKRIDTPKIIPMPENCKITQISCTKDGSCCIDEKQRLLVFGSNAFGELCIEVNYDVNIMYIKQ